MGLQLVPVSNSPFQSISQSLVVDGAPLTLNLSLVYNEMASAWMLSIADSGNNPLVSSIPLLAGSYPAGNILQQQRYLRIGSAFVVNASNASSQTVSGLAYGQGGYGEGPYGGTLGFAGSDYPDDTNLGTAWQLWWGDTPTT